MTFAGSRLRGVAIVALVLMCAAAEAAGSGKLPADFVYLRAVDATIQQDMRYAGANNFTGRPVKGYNAPECILKRGAAEALAKVQARLEPQGLSLKVYDCYRPVRAVRDFYQWSKKPADDTMKEEFYPDLPKRKLFALGYIASRSRHSKGNTVDLTIVPKGSTVPDYLRDAPLKACTLPQPERRADNSLDFGTGYDCFHVLSHTANANVSDAAKKNRALLVREMKAAGFRNYAKEWWHFDLKGGGTSKAYDFVIEGYEGGGEDR